MQTQPTIIDLQSGAPAAYARIVARMRRAPVRLRAYGNLSLLDSPALFMPEHVSKRETSPAERDAVERMTENAVLAGQILVSPYATATQQRACVVPLRWGAPRILIANCGIEKALGSDLSGEPFRAARLWRYQWDPKTDLMLSTSIDDSGWPAWSPTAINLARAIVAASERLAEVRA